MTSIVLYIMFSRKHAINFCLTRSHKINVNKKYYVFSGQKIKVFYIL